MGKRNLVLAVAGDASLHKRWLAGATPEFDLFVVYYGDVGERYHSDGSFYDRAKGVKFSIVEQMLVRHPALFADYDALLIPDDDLLIDAAGWNRFFRLFHEYKLEIAQPAIIGWLSLPSTAVRFDTILRYLACVEIMTPCFTRSALATCRPTFTMNATNWGIDWLWAKLLGNPRDKLAVIDDVVAVHTRPCFFGDTYHRNNNTYQKAARDLAEIFETHGIVENFGTLGAVSRDVKTWTEQPSERKFFPPSRSLVELWRPGITELIPL